LVPENFSTTAITGKPSPFAHFAPAALTIFAMNRPPLIAPRERERGPHPGVPNIRVLLLMVLWNKREQKFEKFLGKDENVPDILHLSFAVRHFVPFCTCSNSWLDSFNNLSASSF